MAFKDLKKDIRWFLKTDLNGNKTQEKTEPKDRVLAFKYIAKRNKTVISVTSKVSAASVAAEYCTF